MTFQLTSVDPDAMFQVRFGLGGSSQLRDLVFRLWTIQPICIECTIRTATMARHNARKPILLFSDGNVIDLLSLAGRVELSDFNPNIIICN